MGFRLCGHKIERGRFFFFFLISREREMAARQCVAWISNPQVGQADRIQQAVWFPFLPT